MKNIRFGLAVIAACGLIVLAAGIRVGVWAHQAEAIADREEFVGKQLLLLRQGLEALLDMDTGQRGYIANGDPSLFTRYNQARRDLDGTLDALNQVADDEDLSHLEQLPLLTKLAKDEIGLAKRAVEQRRQAGDAAGAALVPTIDTGPTVDQFRAQLAGAAERLRLMVAALGREQMEKFHSIYSVLALVVVMVDLSVVVAIITLSSSVQRMHDLQQEQEREAMHDALTSLPNRRYLGEWLTMSLAVARRRGQQIVVLYFDLDGFKQVNDRLGHEAGDRVLQITATRLRRSVRASDFVARLGGDEFVAVLPEAPTPSALAMLIDRLQGEIAKAAIPELTDGAVTASIGAARFPDDGDSIDSLLAAADRAMYEIKQSRRAARGRRRETTESSKEPVQTAAL